MDGLQRVTTIIDYLDNKFALKDLEVWGELEDKTYSELPREIRLSIDRRYLSSIILLKETAKNYQEADMMKKFVFQRLNTGGVELSPQEIRNALFMSEFNDYVTRWAESDVFKDAWGYLDVDSTKRMEDCELVLRFFTYKSACKHNLAMTSIKMLDMYAEEAKAFTNKEIKILDDLFTNTLKIVSHAFGEDPFKSDKDNNKSEKKIFDAVMIACAEYYEENKKDFKWIFEREKGFLREHKFKCIEINDRIFNGKYTAIKNVSERVQLIKNLIKRNYDGI